MKGLETHEWQYIMQVLQATQIKGSDAPAFVELLEKLGHQTELSMKRDNKKEGVK